VMGRIELIRAGQAVPEQPVVDQTAVAPARGQGDTGGKLV